MISGAGWGRSSGSGCGADIRRRCRRTRLGTGALRPASRFLSAKHGATEHTEAARRTTTICLFSPCSLRVLRDSVFRCCSSRIIRRRSPSRPVAAPPAHRIASASDPVASIHPLRPREPMPLETTVVRAAPAGHQTPMLAIAVGRGPLPASLAALDAAAGGALQRLASAGDFTRQAGRDGADLSARPGGTDPARRDGQDRGRERRRHPPSGFARRQADARARRAARALFTFPPKRAAGCRRRRRGRPSPRDWPRAPGSSWR